MTRSHLPSLPSRLTPLRRLALLTCTALILSACGGGYSDGDIASARSFDDTTPPSAAESLQLQAKGAELNARDLDEALFNAESVSPDTPLSADQPATLSAYKSGQVAQKASAQLLPVFRFFNTRTGTHFYTTSTTERDSTIANLPAFSFEGEAFKAASGASPGLTPVYRFFNSQNGVHFYTISESERAAIVAGLPQFKLEGVAYYASQVAGAGLSPLYRFFQPSTGTHFYTASESERQRVQDTLSNTYTFEGVGYYVLGSSFSFGPTFAQQAYVKAANAQANDGFGFSVAISGDTMVVGARDEDSNQTTITNGDTASGNNSAASAGAVYVYTRNGANWVQQAYLKAPNGEAGDSFGRVVAISGDTVVVGVQFESSNQTTVTNGANASANNSADRAGAAYVFVRNGTNWSQQAYLKAPNAEEQDRFGGSVAISGDTIVVGAFQEDSSQTTITNGANASADNSANLAGSAYVFTRSGTNWTQQAFLKAPNANNGANFGRAVAISGDTIIVGAENERSNQTTITNGDTASSNTSGFGTGAAYVFTRSGTNWSQQAYLKAPNAEANDHFGESVAISGDTVVVGASREDGNATTITNGASASGDDSASSAGAAYVFTRRGSTWSHQAYLKAPNAEADDNFGEFVTISGDTIVVGASREDSNATAITNGTSASADNSASSAGAAYVFTRSGSTWSHQAYLKAANAEADDNFGASVAISGNTVVVGADEEDSNLTTITNGTSASDDNTAENAGAAYVFEMRN
jgi:hypothetical protein